LYGQNIDKNVTSKNAKDKAKALEAYIYNVIMYKPLLRYRDI
jgi:hypothetical protein